MQPTIKEKHLYLIAALDEKNIVKIGIADVPSKRIRELQTGNSRRLFFLMCQQVKDAHKVEKALHNLLASYRLNGEWFNIPQDKLYAIRDILWSLDLECSCNGCNGTTNRKLIRGAQ